MSDSCTQKLMHYAQQQLSPQPEARALLLLDDSFSIDDFSLSGLQQQLCIISNRIDYIAPLKALGFDVSFSDFAHDIAASSLDFVFYRISKERMVSHHCLNIATKVLKPGAELCIIGRKEDGIKNYKDKLVKKLGFSGSINKTKDIYTALLHAPQTQSQNPSTSQTSSADSTNTPKLDDGDYHSLREITAVDIAEQHFSLHSKPGVYGWKKLDQGSMFFIDTLSPILSNGNAQADMHVLDLGCGSGHLSLALAAFGFKHICATDNNAAALLATSKTLSENHINADVCASDCGEQLTKRFDMIICNPPFHKGFDTHSALTQKFVNACKRLLKRNGKVFFVVNAFIGIEKLLVSHGFTQHSLANNKQFKVICAQLK